MVHTFTFIGHEHSSINQGYLLCIFQKFLNNSYLLMVIFERLPKISLYFYCPMVHSGSALLRFLILFWFILIFIIFSIASIGPQKEKKPMNFLSQTS